MVETLHIRRANSTDAKALSELSAITFADTFRGTCTNKDLEKFIEEYFNESQVQAELQDVNDFYFLAITDDKLVGYMRMKEGKSNISIISNKKAVELKRIYVVKEYHSKKVGAALMDFALQFAAEKKYEIIFLGVWEHNEKAKTFYKKYGFIDSKTLHAFPIGNTPQYDLWLYKFIE